MRVNYASKGGGGVVGPPKSQFWVGGGYSPLLEGSPHKITPSPLLPPPPLHRPVPPSLLYLLFLLLLIPLALLLLWLCWSGPF